MLDTARETLESLTSSARTDLVGIFKQDYSQVFKNASPIKLDVKEQSKLMEHPLETGATVVDHRIILPVEIEISLILTAEYYRNTYNEIQSLYLDGTVLIVQTKTGIYENQVIGSIDHDEDAEMYDAIPITLHLKQVLYVTAETRVLPRNPQDSSTRDRGNQQPQEKQKSLLFNGTFGRKAA